MIKTLKLLVLNITLTQGFTMTAQNKSVATDKQQLVKIVEQSFAQGALNQLNTEQMLNGFHSAFAILIKNGNDIVKLPLANWIGLVEQYKNSPDKVKSGIRDLDYKIEVLDITDNIAVVKTQFFKNKQLLITDYLSYMKFEDSWKAVSKISKEHITNPLKLDL